jgi:hypothetical protein
MDWSYQVSGEEVARYLDVHTKTINNARKMINVSSGQIENRIGVERTFHDNLLHESIYDPFLDEIFEIISSLEAVVSVKNILTSNKFWEVLVSIPLGHKVNSEQGGRAGDHDAFDESGGDYEYKVSISKSWQFQDISESVLGKYLKCEEIVLAVVDKPNIEVGEIWFAKPEKVVSLLEAKLAEKAKRFLENNKEVRRLQVSLSAGDLNKIDARKII